jgi:hypothetical protein
MVHCSRTRQSLLTAKRLQESSYLRPPTFNFHIFHLTVYFVQFFYNIVYSIFLECYLFVMIYFIIIETLIMTYLF